MAEDKVYDVCFLLEGTYPYVSGGVSSWLHHLVRGMPDLSFTAVCIMPSSKEKLEIRYDIPDNFTNWKLLFLHDPIAINPERLKRITTSRMKTVRNYHEEMRDGDFARFPEIIGMFRNGLMPLYDLVHGKGPWEFVVDSYGPEDNTESFIDYFWTYRVTHLPLFRILQTDIPKARVYHAVSTGYAGLMSVMGKLHHKRPMFLTEHGIYFKERKIEISQADWNSLYGNRRVRMERKLGLFQQFWIRTFRGLSRLTYDHAEAIYTVFSGNMAIEIQDGADPDKLEVIPNGINVDLFSGLTLKNHFTGDQEEVTIGMVGRVVPIKDIKTFIRAVKIVSMHFKKLKVLIMGPYEEDPSYYEECLDVTRLMGLEDVVEYTGKVMVTEYFPRLDLIALTSISEGQPLVILEANCAGIPAVATDVGACRELLEGRTEEDKALGPSGVVVNPSDTMGAANAMISILSDETAWHAMSRAAKTRVSTYYRESDLIDRYESIYREYMDWPDLEVS